MSVAGAAIPGFLKTVPRRISASLKSAQLELSILCARIARIHAQRVCASCAAECGGLAVSERLAFTDRQLAEQCQSGSALLDEIKRAVAELASLQASLSQLDSKSESAKIAEVRGKTKALSKTLKLKRNHLAVLHHQIGEQIIASGDRAERFPDQLRRRAIAVERIGKVESLLTAAKGLRRELNASIGMRFQVLAAAVMIVLLAMVWMLQPSSTKRRISAAVEGTTSAIAKAFEPAPARAAGLSRQELALSAQLVQLHWVAWRPGTKSIFSWNPAPDADDGCTGSAGVIATRGGTLWLVTNRHVLMLEAIEASKTTDIALKSYDMQVKFPSGQTRPVKRIAHLRGSLDLAVLEVDATNLSEGTDFVTLPPAPKEMNIQVGDEAVCVGNPGIDDLTFEGTQTFGHISAFREDPPDDNSHVCKWIQIDTAINQGNSGGPLFAKENDRYFWVGVNTLGFGHERGYEGLNMAIDARQLANAELKWYDATKEGTAKALTEWYQFPTGVYTPPRP